MSGGKASLNLNHTAAAFHCLKSKIKQSPRSADRNYDFQTIARCCIPIYLSLHILSLCWVEPRSFMRAAFITHGIHPAIASNSQYNP